MPSERSSAALRPREVVEAWGRILVGRSPILSIEITRECPLSCPGCYAYGDQHLGGGVNLRALSDFRGDELVTRVVNLVKEQRPVHTSLVGGEPLVRVKELSRILPQLAELGTFTMVVTSGIVPIPHAWMDIPRTLIAISIDGLPEHHDIRRKPATYERILKNIAGAKVTIHWTITAPMLERPGYLEEYVKFWSERPEVHRILVSTYTPQRGEQSPEMISSEQRDRLVAELLSLRANYPKLLMNERIADAFLVPPASPAECTFARMSQNFSADLKTKVEPCVFGGDPDCSKCGCAASAGIHALRNAPLGAGVKVGHLVGGSIAVGKWIGKLFGRQAPNARWQPPQQKAKAALVNIS